jgi:hypothetical protein
MLDLILQELPRGGEIFIVFEERILAPTMGRPHRGARFSVAPTLVQPLLSASET